MNLNDTRRYEMLVRVGEFGVSQAGAFPPDSLGGQMFAAAKAAAAAVAGHAAAEMSSRAAVREGVFAREGARERLLTLLEGVRRTAQAVALDTPGVDGKFRVPSSRGARTLAVAARAFSMDAHALSAALIAHGLPAKFLDDLDAAILAFETAIHDHARATTALRSARAALETALQGGLTAVQRLDAIVPNLLHDDHATYAVWQLARLVDQAPRVRNRSRTPALPPTPGTPPATVPVTTAEPPA